MKQVIKNKKYANQSTISVGISQDSQKNIDLDGKSRESAEDSVGIVNI